MNKKLIDEHRLNCTESKLFSH